ncbi:MAG TPA: exosortase H [Usitatibacter sp.]|nr:exosortase H [Usitatibacter sp.]
MIRFVAVFIVITVALFAAELTPPVQRMVVAPWTNALARLSADVVTLVDPQVSASGKVLRSTRTGFSVSIEAGCNGIEASIILIAAIVAFPAPWLHRIAGIAAGLVAVQVLNLVRVVSLFYLGQWSLAAFQWAHLYVWQALIMLDALIVWLVWLRRLPPTTAAPQPHAA